MFEKFTRQARQVVVDAHEESRRLGHDYVGTEHLLLALLGPDSDGAARLLAAAGLTPDGVRAGSLRRWASPGCSRTPTPRRSRRSASTSRRCRRGSRNRSGRGRWRRSPRSSGPVRRRRTRFTPRSKKVLELALREALRLRHRGIGTEHLLLGLIREGQGLAARIMAEAGIDLPTLRRTTEESLRVAAPGRTRVCRLCAARTAVCDGVGGVAPPGPGTCVSPLPRGHKPYGGRLRDGVASPRGRDGAGAGRRT